MSKIILFLLTVSYLLTSCKNQSNKEVCTADKKFKMYKMSEMSTLMEQMYVENESLKKRIQNGDTIGKFPNHFMQIHNAVMTDPSENDDFFKTQAKIFITAQEQIYKDPKNAKTHFNESVAACISCHEVKCGGPIVRIKKLYIQ